MSKQTKKTDPKKPSNEAEHQAQEREKRLTELQSQEPELHAEMMSRSKADQDAYIALRGGLPKYQAPAKKAGPPPTPTNWKELGFGTPKRKPAGYRYNVGSGKPAKESPTRRRKINLK